MASRLPPLLALAALLGAAGCASETDVAAFPPPARPAVSPPPTTEPAGRVRALRGGRPRQPAARLGGDRYAEVDPRARTVSVAVPPTGRRTETAPAGVGPSQVAADDGRLFVTDTGGEALLVFATEPELSPIFRIPVIGAPVAVATDLDRDVVLVAATATNRVLAYDTSARPKLIGSFPSVRQVRALAVERASGRVVVDGAEASQVVPPAAYSRRR